MHSLNDWLKMIGEPGDYQFAPSWTPGKKYDFDFGQVEYYEQANGPGTVQRVIVAMPKNVAYPVPAVVTPFYIPEEMLGFVPETGEVLEKYVNIAMMKHLTARGYATISAEAYHITYLPELDEPPENFSRWKLAGEALTQQHPTWTGVGKLIFDTRLLIDRIAADPRVDAARIGIAGHSLGGKMAFYTGMVDRRIKAVLASDFGIGFEQTNWSDIWYWGDKLELLKQQQFDHSELLSATGGKPFCLLAGQYDNAHSWAIMQQATGYETCPERLKIINHATGHRPPLKVLFEGYDFLDRFLK